jgi:isopenicillin N synthase-like dioxygenase
MASTQSSSSGALPVVDLAPFFSTAEDAAAARARATEAVREACMDTGFFRIVNHGVPREFMARVLELSAAYFALPDEEKSKVLPAEGSSSTPLPAGYLRPPADSPDKNEYLLVFNPELWLNVYPAEPAGFRSSLR